MKKIRSVVWFPAALSMLLCLSVLAGCTQSAGADTQSPAVQMETAGADTQPPAVQTETAGAAAAAEELSLAKCRAALEDIGSYESYHVVSDNQFEGEAALNNSSKTYYWKSGEDWLKISRIPMGAVLEDGTFMNSEDISYLCKDGNYYNTERDGYQDVYGVVHWGKSSAPQESAPWFYNFDAPWLCSFDWDAQEVRYVSALEEEDGQSIRIQVMAPYKNTQSESYNVEFYFDTNDCFRKAVVEVREEVAGEALNCRYTESVVTTEAAAIAAEIDAAYQNAVKGCGDKSCTVCYGED